LPASTNGQLLPDAHEMDVPAVGIGGKVPLTESLSEWLPQHLSTMKNMILPPRDFLFTAAFRRRRSLADAVRSVRGELNTMGVEAEAFLNGAEDFDYVMWAFVTHRSTFARGAGALDGKALRERIQQRMSTWHPTLRRLVAETDVSTISAFDFSPAAAVRPWQTSNVTLLGDALHFMPPVGGMGGNAALHDARLLCDALTSVMSGKEELIPALHRYEAAMIANGFSAVRASILYTRLAISRFRPLRSVARLFFRACGRFSSLRQAVFQ
jgi:flavin-dependent dehydrogenase